MDYPWYQIVRGTNLAQGDLLEACPVLLPRADLPSAEPDTLFFDEELRDVIVVSQTCDLVAGREKVSEVLLCAVWNRGQLTPPHHLATAKGLEEASFTSVKFHGPTRPSSAASISAHHKCTVLSELPNS